MYRGKPERDYQDDPEFHALVDMLEDVIRKARFSPSELRQAVVLAAIHYEQKTERPLRITEEMADALGLDWRES